MLGTIVSVSTPITLLCLHNIPKEVDVMVISGNNSLGNTGNEQQKQNGATDLFDLKT